MGEAKRSRGRAEILTQGQRCIYCAELATTIEHMPPRSMFQGKRRPSGMEFPCCTACNSGTSAADLVAGFFARVSPQDPAPDWKGAEAYDRLSIIDKKALGLIAEIFDRRKIRDTWIRGTSGLFEKRVLMKLDGPLVAAYLDTFAAKFGMALYREHCSEPIPLEGGVQSAFFLNAGLSQATADKVLSTLPSANTLTQGEKNSVQDQFFYRFNTDGRSVVAALARFHDGLYVLTVAFADRETYGALVRPPRFRLVRPGEVVSMMPRPPRPSGLILPAP